MSVSAVERAILASQLSRQLIAHTAVAVERARTDRLERAALGTQRSSMRAAHAAVIRNTGAAVGQLRASVEAGHQTATLMRALMRLQQVERAVVAPSRPAPTTDRSALPPTVRRAMRFIEQNAHEQINASDIASASFVTVRAVQIAFQRHLGTTPLAYLKSVRLTRAREDLLAGPAAHAYTVTAVAERWHFSNTGRFGAYYREAFGEAPKQTLHRTRTTSSTGPAATAPSSLAVSAQAL